MALTSTNTGLLTGTPGEEEMYAQMAKQMQQEQSQKQQQFDPLQAAMLLGGSSGGGGGGLTVGGGSSTYDVGKGASGAMTGAMMGAPLGPPGMIAGGTIGALGGLQGDEEGRDHFAEKSQKLAYEQAVSDKYFADRDKAGDVIGNAIELFAFPFV